MTSLSGKMLGLVVLATLLTALSACSSGSEKGAQGTGEDLRSGETHRETTDATEGAAVTPALEGETTAITDRRATWDYVALGDSLAAGVGAHRGYVDRYAEHLRNDTGARVRLVNLGQSGQTSPQLLYALRNDPSMRRAIGGAEVITFNIGINDLGQAGGAYENGTCGGGENEWCLRVAVEEVVGNWDAIFEEILSLRSTQDTIVRTAGLGYTPNVDGVFGPYLAKVNRHIASSAAHNSIPYVEVHLGDESMNQDGVHPNDKGYEVIAKRLRGLGYEPLGPR